MPWIARLMPAMALLALANIAYAGPVYCFYSEQQIYTGSDTAPDGTRLGGPTHSGSGDYAWTYVIDAPDGTHCPMPKMPHPGSGNEVTAPGLGGFAAGGGSNGDDGFALLRHANGHVTLMADSHAKFRFPDGAIEAITDARLVAASSTFGLVVHNNGSVSMYGPTSAGMPQIGADVTEVVGIRGMEAVLLVHQDGSVSAQPRAYVPPWTNVVQISADSSYAVTRQGTVLGPADRDAPVYSRLTNARAVEANIHQGVALLADGTVVAWDRAYGPPRNQDAYNIPHPPPGLTDVKAIAAGDSFFIALKGDGTVVQWGWPHQDLPPAGLKDVIAIAAASDYSFAAAEKKDGSVVIWHPRI